MPFTQPSWHLRYVVWCKKKKKKSVSNSVFLSVFLLSVFSNIALFLIFQESFEGQMTEENIEVGICNEAGFKRLTPAEVKDYLAAIA